MIVTTQEKQIIKNICIQDNNWLSLDKNRPDLFHKEKKMFCEIKKGRKHKTLTFTEKWNGTYLTKSDHKRLLQQIERYPKPFLVRIYEAHSQTPVLIKELEMTYEA